MGSRNRLKLWVMTSEYHPRIVGGLGIVATQLTRKLSKTGMDVTVLCTSEDGENQLDRSRVNGKIGIIRIPKDKKHYRKSSRSFRPKPLLGLSTSTASDPPDLIHVHSTEYAAAARAAASKFGIPLVYTCHSLASKGIHSRQGKNQTQLIRSAAKIVVPSKWQAAEIKDLYPKSSRGKVSVIPNGVKSVRRRRKLKGSSHELLYVGRIIPDKGIKSLIRAIALLSRAHKNVHLTIVGKGKSMKSSRALTRRLGISKNIHWIPNRKNEEVLAMYSSYGAVIVPSKKESFCLVALEAMASGVPLVSTLSGGLSEFVNAKNAQIIRSVDSKSIAKAITSMWNKPAKTKKRIKNARLTAKRYRWRAIARQYKSLFLNMTKVI
ncbi:glycosyltransferase family 4 protein [Paenibacillus terrigena]|uniref:glycosyltransferase family 4 protein n=1 Tax=Paenibacillus terrigena TaxID=369333 RepID=UPI0003696B11|nr:glycosyltransferase family 4 protein [Paenibacillus terrigena]